LDVFCGIDWAEDHQDVALVDAGGQVLARLRITDDAAGLAALLELLAQHGDSRQYPVPAAIETPRGLLVACLRATGRPVYPVNPMPVARYRDRHSVAGRKSDKGDATVLANVLRTDLHAHRPLPADSELAQAVAVLARAQQDAVWERVHAQNKLRSHLREYFPGFLAAFGSARGGITRPEARAVLAAAPTPADAARLTRARPAGLLRKAAGSVASKPRPPGCTPPSARSRCASFPSLSRPWAARPWPCCGSWTPPAVRRRPPAGRRRVF
jgi:transposase